MSNDIQYIDNLIQHITPSLTPRINIFRIVKNILYSVMQSDRKSLKTDTFHEPKTYEPHVKTSSEQIITFARHE